MGNLGFRTFRDDTLVGGPDLAASFVLGKFQRLYAAWPAWAPSSSGVLLGGSFWLRSLFYLHGDEFIDSAILKIRASLKNLF